MSRHIIIVDGVPVEEATGEVWKGMTRDLDVGDRYDQIDVQGQTRTYKIVKKRVSDGVIIVRSVEEVS